MRVQKSRARGSDEDGAVLAISASRTSCFVLQLREHCLARHAHEIRRGDVRIPTVEEPAGRGVSFPPENLAHVLLFGQESLHGNHAALVVYAENHARENVEKDPCAGPEASEASGDAKGGEKEGHGGEEEAGFLVGEDGEGGCAC